MDVRDFSFKVPIEHFWVTKDGVKWCVFWLDGHPILACEKDTR